MVLGFFLHFFRTPLEGYCFTPYPKWSKNKKYIAIPFICHFVIEYSWVIVNWSWCKMTKLVEGFFLHFLVPPRGLPSLGGGDFGLKSKLNSTTLVNQCYGPSYIWKSLWTNQKKIFCPVQSTFWFLTLVNSYVNENNESVTFL